MILDVSTHPSSNAITPFSFDGVAVRVIDADGEPWFVGKDVAEVLGYSDADKAVRDHCKSLKLFKPADLAGLGFESPPPRGLNFIPERDVYRLVMRSKLPAAERFEDWVVGTVLPTIRKTGSYSALAAASATSLPSVATDLKAAMSICEMLGLDGNQRIIGATHAVRKTCGVDVLELTGTTHLIAEDREIPASPTDLAAALPLPNPRSGARKINGLLEAKGFQTKDGKGRWQLTEAGKEFGLMVEQPRANAGSGSVIAPRWYPSRVLPMLREHFTQVEES